MYKVETGRAEGDQMSRVKQQLQDELTVAQAQIKNLTTENRLLKITERRQGNALSKYEGTHAQLPQVVRSYSEDLRSLQTRLWRMKKSYRNLENCYRTKTAELLNVQKQYKHLLDLTKNKQLGEREKLSNQLEEAENMIKIQEKQNQNLIKKIELQDKNYQVQINAEIRKAKQLRAELKDLRETKIRLELKVEKLKYQNYAGKYNYVWGASNKFRTPSKPKAPSKNSLLNDACPNNHGDHVVALPDSRKKSLKPELVDSESDISDHTKDLQKKLMKQIHEDIINKPDMLTDSGSDLFKSSDTKLWLDHEISESIRGRDLLSDGCNENIAQNIKPIVTGNPFTLSSTSRLRSIEKLQKYSQKRLIRRSSDEHEDDIEDEDEVSSISSVSDTS